MVIGPLNVFFWKGWDYNKQKQAQAVKKKPYTLQYRERRKGIFLVAGGENCSYY
jgi:hypothetical protein